MVVEHENPSQFTILSRTPLSSRLPFVFGNSAIPLQSSPDSRHNAADFRVGAALNDKFLGRILAIPAGEAAIAAKVIFASQYFSDVIAIQLYLGKPVSTEPREIDIKDDDATVYYTSGREIRSKRWKIIGQIDVTDGERRATERTAGGEIWIEDRHLGQANDEQIADLPEMRIHGWKLIEKYAARSLA